MFNSYFLTSLLHDSSLLLLGFTINNNMSNLLLTCKLIASSSTSVLQYGYKIAATQVRMICSNNLGNILDKWQDFGQDYHVV